jgi:hypothetical protein
MTAFAALDSAAACEVERKLRKMVDRTQGLPGRGELKPVESRAAWISWGFALQATGVGIPVIVALRHSSRDGPLGSITHYTVRLVWHEMIRSHADVALVVLGVLIFIAGAVVLARPFATRRSTLLVAIPVMAIAGLAVLGVVALLCAAVIALAESSGDGLGGLLDGFPGWSSGDRRKRRK